MVNDLKGDPTFIVWVYDDVMDWFIEGFYLDYEEASRRCEGFDQAYIEETTSIEVEE